MFDIIMTSGARLHSGRDRNEKVQGAKLCNVSDFVTDVFLVKNL